MTCLHSNVLLGESLTKGKSDINSSVTTNLTTCKVLDDVQGSVLWTAENYPTAQRVVSALCVRQYTGSVLVEWLITLGTGFKM